MKPLTEHLWFETPHQHDHLNITSTTGTPDLSGSNGHSLPACRMNPAFQAGAACALLTPQTCPEFFIAAHSSIAN